MPNLKRTEPTSTETSPLLHVVMLGLSAATAVYLPLALFAALMVYPYQSREPPLVQGFVWCVMASGLVGLMMWSLCVRWRPALRWLPRVLTALSLVGQLGWIGFMVAVVTRTNTPLTQAMVMVMVMVMTLLYLPALHVVVLRGLPHTPGRIVERRWAKLGTILAAVLAVPAWVFSFLAWLVSALGERSASSQYAWSTLGTLMDGYFLVPYIFLALHLLITVVGSAVAWARREQWRTQPETRRAWRWAWIANGALGLLVGLGFALSYLTNPYR